MDQHKNDNKTFSSREIGKLLSAERIVGYDKGYSAAIKLYESSNNVE